MFKNANSLQRWSRRIAGEAGKLWTPKVETCLCCTNPRSNLSGRLKLCVDCLAKIPWIRHVECKVCGRDETCTDCVRRRDRAFAANRSIVRYDATVKEWLALYKYRGQERLGELFGELIAMAFERELKEFELAQKDICCITYVPLSEQRLDDRGFNQAEVFARCLANKYLIPVADLLMRTRHTEKQSYKTRAERIHDLQGVFAFKENRGGKSVEKEPFVAKSPSPPLNVLLIDDVYTTGSTLEECAKAIRSHMNCTVYGLTLAR